MSRASNPCPRGINALIIAARERVNYTVMATPFKVKLQKAQFSCIEFDKIASVPLVGMCTAPSNAIGCPVEFIFFPLLTIVAARMGINGHVKVNTIKV